MSRRLATAILGGLLVALAVPLGAAADLRDEQALAQRYAPVVRLVEQPEECGPGEPYEPMDVDRLFGQSTVALRGPWNPTDLVKIGPTAKDLAGLYEYHLDFPGNALDPGCDYERWARRLTTGHEPAVYAHVATDAGFPGKLALQYWFFYPFNDFNNTHEGDWEMIQLVFDAPDAARGARAEQPVQVGYSSHEGAERATGGREARGRRRDAPGRLPGGRLAREQVHGGAVPRRSADAGVGCDDTRGPHRELRPCVRTIPSDPAAAAAAFPGSPSRDAGASSRRRSSTGRPGRT